MKNMNTQAKVTMSNEERRAFTLIDHFGSLDSALLMQKAYAKAFSLSVHKKERTFTMKGFCKKLSKSEYTRVSEKQKNYVRFTFNPAQVIIIVPEITPAIQWRIDIWLEKADMVTVIEAYEDCDDIMHLDINHIGDMHPELVVTRESSISRPRRCANIWANALGWQFSAPLYRDNTREMDEMYMARPDRRKYKDNLEMASHTTKIASRPESYINAKIAVASEKECEAFFNYYAYLQRNNLLAEFLEPGYEICPCCGRPVRVGASNTKSCMYCDFEDDDVEIDTFFEESFDD